MKTTKKLSILAVAALLLGSAGGAFAGTTSGTIAVSGTVVASCTVATTALAFGANLNVLSGANIDGTATVTATCSTDAPYTIKLNAGTTAGATVTARKMVGGTGGTGNLNYALYSETTRTNNWGEDAATDKDVVGDGTAQVHTVYARIPSGQNTVSIGAYTDTITATVDF